MTKAELVRFLEPFTDNLNIFIKDDYGIYCFDLMYILDDNGEGIVHIVKDYHKKD